MLEQDLTQLYCTLPKSSRERCFVFCFGDLPCISESNPLDFWSKKYKPPSTQKTPNEKSQTRTTATIEVHGPMKNPKRQKNVARRSTIRIAPVSCQDGMEAQNGPSARVMKISQFSVREISRKSTSFRLPN